MIADVLLPAVSIAAAVDGVLEAGVVHHVTRNESIAAGTLLIREAGGVITDFNGRDIGIEHTGGLRATQQYTSGCSRP
jgi:fructose-1,6-bisphosphatase/inositol monophosphatase family enzyme